MAHFEDELFNRVNNEIRLQGLFPPLGMSFEQLSRIARPQPKKVIFNDPATIVIWKDGSKTVVKLSKGDTYDKEKGFAFCMLKKIYGNDYYKTIRGNI